MSVGVELDCLKDIRVVDFTQLSWPVLHGSPRLADAEVVKIERMGKKERMGDRSARTSVCTPFSSRTKLRARSVRD